jgi:hypothetical protein
MLAIASRILKEAPSPMAMVQITALTWLPDSGHSAAGSAADHH